MLRQGLEKSPTTAQWQKWKHKRTKLPNKFLLYSIAICNTYFLLPFRLKLMKLSMNVSTKLKTLLSNGLISALKIASTILVKGFHNHLIFPSPLAWDFLSRLSRLKKRISTLWSPRVVDLEMPKTSWRSRYGKLADIHWKCQLRTIVTHQTIYYRITTLQTLDSISYDRWNKRGLPARLLPVQQLQFKQNFNKGFSFSFITLQAPSLKKYILRFTLAPTWTTLIAW